MAAGSGEKLVIKKAGLGKEKGAFGPAKVKLSRQQ